MVAAHGEQAGNGHYFILPTDVKRADSDRAIPGSGLNVLDWSDIQAPVNRAHGRRFIFVDACHSGRAKELRGYNEKLLAEARAERFVLFAATGPTQLAQGDAELGHGLFTHALASGLAGKALDEVERAVRVYRLGDHLYREVKGKSGGSQEPEFYSGIGNVVMVKKW
jgi:uncharacterized caspase-like protein